jgi:type IV pilus assembly protein PilC
MSMQSYNYVAVNELGRKMRGEISAANEVDLEERLRQIGLDLVDYRIAKQKKAGMWSKVTTKDMIILCLHLEQLDRAGVPLLDSLADVRDSTESAKLRNIMTDVYESVKGGKMLSEALAQHPKEFGEVFTGLIAAGEKTGNLSEAFAHLAHHMKWVADIKRKIRKAMGYPIMLLFVMSIVITVLMMFVVPKLVNFITSQGFDMPIHTRALIATSAAFADYWYLIFGIPILSVIFIIIFYRISPGFAYRFDGMMLKLPVMGPTIRKMDMARFSHFFAVMFRSGIDILESLAAAKNVVGNLVLQESISMVRTSVSEGTSLTSSLRISNQFPNLVIRMFKVGEESGNMNEALENINFFYDREVNDAVDAMVGLIQPVLTMIMGGLIFWVAAAVFGPLYQSFSKMQF